MIENQDGSVALSTPSRRVFITIAVAVACLLAVIFALLQLGRQCAARQVPMEFAVQIELDLALGHLRFGELLSGDTATSMDAVQQHLMRADWHALQIEQECAKSRSVFFLGDEQALRTEVATFREQLARYIPIVLSQAPGDDVPSSVDARIEPMTRELMVRARQIKASVTALMRVQQLTLYALQMGLVVGSLLTAGFLGVTLHRHLTGRSRMEAALRESEEKFRSLYEMSNDAIMLLDKNRFFDCNEAALRIFQVEGKEKFCCMHPADLSSPTQPDGSDSLTAANERIATALRAGSHRFEWVHKRSDGTEFPAEVLLSRVHIEGRRVLQGVVRDVTARKRAEELLKANEEKFRTISEAALDSVVMMDSRGRAVHWNPAAEKMFGYAPDEILGRDIHSLITPDRFRPEAQAALSRFFATGQGRAVGRVMELQAIRKGGEEFPIEISLAPIRVDNHWCAVAVVRDITDRKRAEELLRAEQQTLRRLLKSHDQERKLIAYEIHDGLAQQLVAAIMQCQAVAHSAEHDPGEQRARLAQLLTLLRNCLAETRQLISGVRPPILDEFGVVRAIQVLIDDTHAREGVQVEFENTVALERLEPVLENSIYRIIQESLRNACRHSESPKVLIQLAHSEGNIRIRVQDWGIGFDPRQVDRRRYGLAGIRERVRLMGGQLTIDSAPGNGTTVSVVLPDDVGELADVE